MLKTLTVAAVAIITFNAAMADAASDCNGSGSQA